MSRRRSADRGSWYLLTGLLIGVAAGLLYAWLFSPVEYINTAPASLRTDFKAQYRALVGAAFLASGNVDRAQKRLAELKDGDIASQVSAAAQAWMDGTHPESEVRGLNLLAAALHGSVPAFTGPTPAATTPLTTTTGLAGTPVIILTSSLDFTPTPTPRQSPTPSPRPLLSLTPTPSMTPLPTRTATPTPGGVFVLQKQEFICSPNLIPPLIEVETLDAAGAPVPGVEIVVRWDGGEDSFFTGLKPDISLGYADFIMAPGITYNLQLTDGGQPVNGLTATECEAAGAGRIWGSWKLHFQQP